MSRIDWAELRRRAAAEYERSGEGRRRREAGSQAVAQAEELAWWARHRPDSAPVALGGGVGVDADAVLATALAADQSVYVYRGGVMLAHLEPSTIYEPVVTPAGMALRTLLQRRDGSYMHGPEWAAGEWDFVGRGHPGE